MIAVWPISLVNVQCYYESNSQAQRNGQDDVETKVLPTNSMVLIVFSEEGDQAR